MAHMYEYSEKSLLGGWKIEVRKGRTHIGNIRRKPPGGFHYFSGPQNQLNPSLDADTIEELKKRIEARF